MSTITPSSTGARPTDAPARAGTVEGEGSYRYPGSPPFRDVDIDRRLFKGRDEEAKQVFHSILSCDVFLLYAVSGMGKSSLLNAGVLHRLRERGYWPVSVRLNETSVSPVQSIERQIVDADIRDTEVEVLRTPGLDFDIGAETTLWDLLGSLEVWRNDRLQQLVVVLDQFEELFTLDWEEAARHRFISQFGEVVRGHRSVESGDASDASAVPVPNVKFCIVIREDALGELEALADDVPQIMQNRFRLGALDATQAESAIREPAMVDDGALDTPPFRYSESAAQHILEFLQDTVRAGTGVTAEANAANSVDPSQLQIICQYVERRVLPAKVAPPDGDVVTIEATDLGGKEGLRDVIGDFYRRTIASFPPTTQRTARRLCEEGLISKSGRRLSLERDQISVQYDVPSDVLHALVDQRLLRVEPRVGSEYYELSHDTLVKPILEDRTERRKARSHRRRRFAFIAAGAVAVLALGFLAYRVGFDEGNTSNPSLEFESTLSGAVDEPGEVERFQVIAREQPSLVLVEPSEEGDGFDASVALTDSSKARRSADQLGRGQAERIVVPAGPGDVLEVAVSSSDASTGQFDVTLGPLTVTPLGATDGGSETINGTIDDAGGVAVYSVDLGDEPVAEGSEPSVEIVVASPGGEETSGEAGDSRAGVKPDAGLDVEIDVIDPSGAGRSIDQQAIGNGERTTVKGSGGQYLVVVRDHLGDTGPFEITATRVTSTTLSVDETAEGDIESADVPAVFAVDVPAGTGVGVTVTPAGDLDAMLEVVDDRGESTRSIDSSGIDGPETALLTVAGRYLVRVSGYEGSVGSFEIVTAPVQSVALTDGERVTATSPAAFTLEATSPTLVVVRSTSELDPMLEIVSPGGDSSFADSSGSGGIEMAEVRDGGQYIVRVSGFEGSVGSFELVADSVVSAELAEDESVVAAAPAAFDVEVDAGEILAFTAESAGTNSVLGVLVNDPDGFATGFSSSSPAAGEPAVAIIDGSIAGPHRVLVASSEPQSDVTVSLRPVETQELVANDPVTTAAPAVFSVEVTRDRLLTFIAQPASADSILDLRVNGPDGGATGLVGRSPAPGEPATVSLGAGLVGVHQIFVTSSTGRTEVTATVRAVEVQRVVVGSGPITGNVAPAVFDIELAPGERRLVIVTPQDDEELFLEISSPGRDEPTYGYADGPGQAGVALLSGEGTHEVRVTGSGLGDGSFVIETEPIGRGG